MNVSLSTAAARVAAVTACLLAIPLIAMRFTNEVTWSVGDFVVAAALLFAAGMTFVVAARRARSTAQRRGIAILVLAVLAVVWAELAVGLFD